MGQARVPLAVCPWLLLWSGSESKSTGLSDVRRVRGVLDGGLVA